MSLDMCLRQARNILLSCGWSEPMCVDAHGVWVASDSQHAARFSVAGALILTSTDDAEFLAAVDVLEQVTVPARHAADNPGFSVAEATPARLAAWRAACRNAVAAKQPGLQDWLEHPQRKLEHVLRAFDVAIGRARAKEAA